MNDDADSRWIAGIRAGDTEALANYLQEVRPQLLAYVQRNMRDGLRRKLDPEDVVQETCADAVRRLPSMEWRDQQPFSWLCQIAEHRLIDAHRHFFEAKKRDAAKEAPLVQGDGTGGRADFANLLANSLTTPSQAFSRNAREARLHAALAELPEPQREALRMRYVENLPSKEIAARLNKSDASIRVMLTRSVNRLREILEAGEG